MNYKADHTFV